MARSEWIGGAAGLRGWQKSLDGPGLAQMD
jgi:hypothetical protein